MQAAPIYVYFDVDEATVQRLQTRMIAKGITPGARSPDLPLKLALGDTGDFAYDGVIDYVDNKVDATTGTIKVRGILKNENRAIAPGFFARVRVPDADPYQAVLVPERSIGVDQGQKYVFTVNDKGVVELRTIETGSQQGRMRVVKSGLRPDEWIITEGILRTRPARRWPRIKNRWRPPKQCRPPRRPLSRSRKRNPSWLDSLLIARSSRLSSRL